KALADVRDERDYQLAATRMNHVEADLGGKFAAVFSACRNLHPAAHHAGFWRLKKSVAMRPVAIVEALRHQDFYRLTDEFLFVVTKQLLPVRIELTNHPGAIHRNDSLDRRFEVAARTQECILLRRNRDPNRLRIVGYDQVEQQRVHA